MSNLLLRRLPLPSLTSRWLNACFSSQTPTGESTNQPKRGIFGYKPDADKTNAEPTNADPTDERKHGPIAFLNTSAGKWSPIDDEVIKYNKRPKYQDLIVCGSMIVFMIYFSILREENDVDQKLTRTLDQTMYDIELEKLNKDYQERITNNQSVVSIKNRLTEMGHPIN